MAKLLFRYDALHKRVDITRSVVVALWVGGSLVWALATVHGQGDFWGRLVAAMVFVLSVRAILAGLWDARLASMVAALLGLFALGTRTPWQVVHLVAFMAMVLALEEYFKRRTKVVALVLGVVVGLVAASVGAGGKTMLLLFGLALLGRIVWHALFERFAKLALIIFTIKAVAAAVIAAVLFKVLRHHVHLPWAASSLGSWPHVPLWAAVLTLVLGVWGLIATLLIKTERSPHERSMRLYLLAYGASVLTVVTFLWDKGTVIFLPNALRHLDNGGLRSFSPEVMIFLVVGVMLSISAGIGRWQYKDMALARRIRQRL